MTVDSEFMKLFDKIFVKIDTVMQRLSSLEASQTGFWGRDWPSVMRTVTDNQTRIAAMELELGKLKTKIAISGAIVVFALTSIVAISASYISNKASVDTKTLQILVNELQQNRKVNHGSNPH